MGQVGKKGGSEDLKAYLVHGDPQALSGPPKELGPFVDEPSQRVAGCLGGKLCLGGVLRRNGRGPKGVTSLQTPVGGSHAADRGTTQLVPNRENLRNPSPCWRALGSRGWESLRPISSGETVPIQTTYLLSPRNSARSRCQVR